MKKKKFKWINGSNCLLQHNRTALHYAVAGKNKEAVQVLLQRRVKVDQKDKVSAGVLRMHTCGT